MSYNSKWWLCEQEIRGQRNWDKPAKEMCWYRCITKNKLTEDPLSGLYYDDHGTAQETLEEIIQYYRKLGYDIRIKVSTRTGFLPKDAFGVIPYLGQWGKGWIIATSKEASTVCATYILISGGDPDGIADYYQ